MLKMNFFPAPGTNGGAAGAPVPYILETERLFLREMAEGDYRDLCAVLQDAEAMYAYEHAFSDEEVWDWLRRQQERYRKDGFGLWAAVEKRTGEMVGQAGITLQEIEGEMLLEIGYLLKRRHWHKGYASEAAVGCREYAFAVLRLPRVYSIIRENNFPSRRVAERGGMRAVKTVVKHYYGMDMPHLVYCRESGQA